jgi:hydrogenase maturation protease
VAVRVLIGGLGYRWQRDASFGVVASDALAEQEWPDGVEVMDLGYGAIYVAQDLLHAEPPYDRLVLLAGAERGRRPGGLYRSRWRGELPDAEEIQELIREAGSGILSVEHLLFIAMHFQALPREVVLIEIEPVDGSIGEALSPPATQRLAEAIELARREALAPLCRERPCPEGGMQR